MNEFQVCLDFGINETLYYWLTRFVEEESAATGIQYFVRSSLCWQLSSEQPFLTVCAPCSSFESCVLELVPPHLVLSLLVSLRFFLVRSSEVRTESYSSFCTFLKLQRIYHLVDERTFASWLHTTFSTHLNFESRISKLHPHILRSRKNCNGK